MTFMASGVSVRAPVIDALMFTGWQWVRDQVYEGVRAAGYRDITPAHVALVRSPTLDGLRPTEIAQRMQITRQSVHGLLTHLELHGYLVRQPDAVNRQARVVRLTANGRRLEVEIQTQSGVVEAAIAVLLGEDLFSQLRDGMTRLAEEVGARRPPAHQAHVIRDSTGPSAGPAAGPTDRPRRRG